MKCKQAPSLVATAEAFALPRYREPHRAYHNEQHIRAVLAALSDRQLLTPTLALAVWGHDLVYDPRAHDNEERSAEVFDAWLAAQSADRDLRMAVRALILATKHTRAPANRAECLLVDADLSILGADEAAFDAYDASIRLEYAHVPEDAYRDRRCRILGGFLDRSRIFTTAEFASLETRARVNLARALAGLQAED